MNYAASGGGSGVTTLLFLVAMIGVMYLLIIRPNQRRRKQMAQMQSEVTPGAQVITIGGLHGTVVEMDDDVAVIEAAPGVNLRYARGAITRVVEAGEAEAETDDEAETTDDADSVIERTEK